MIPFFFNILFFLIPLIFYKSTSELFEFNKIVTLYTFTALIVSAWALQSIRTKKFIFHRTLLDYPLIIYLSIYLISSLFSIDPRTSWLGYYGRFNGGLVSQICYALLYWAFVSNLNKKQSLHATYYILLSTAIASILAIGEHYGIFATCGLMGFGLKESCWVQDVQNRVFSTLGQPNWLAATVVSLIPLTWSAVISNFQFPISKQFSKFKFPISKILWFLISILLFITLLFTKSRSGLLAFGIEVIIFWGFVFWQSKFKHLKEFIILFLVFGFMFFVFSSPITNHQLPVTVSQGNSLETGGTESGTIRKFVWLGAWEVFKHYPILGTGPETFAFSFPMYRPVEHNLTSEWDFIYNKAHNEFLNYLANTGILGFGSYIALIIFSIIQMLRISNVEYRNQKQFRNSNFKNYNLFRDSDFGFRISLFSGYVAILVTNFFGFSVVPVSLLFFLFPAVAVASSMQDVVWLKPKKLALNQYILISCVLLSTFYILHTTYSYWQADIYFNKSDFKNALLRAPNEPNYISKLALSENSIETSFKALQLNPLNQNTRKILINSLTSNSDKNQNNLLIAENVILDGIDKSPNDPKLYYQLGILQLKMGENIKAIKSLEKSINLKPNYKEGRFALGVAYKALNEKDKSKEQFEYILKFIDLNDELTKRYLDEII